MSGSLYNGDFYDHHNKRADDAARAILPIVYEYISPRSVVDIGCGEGGWLKVFAERGAQVFGVDGLHVEPSRLLIPATLFRGHDLEQPLTLNQRFDLAVSLETAEHLTPKAASQLVDTLTKVSDYVLFSAAIKGQGGTGHINEQWPDYWRSLFRERGFERLDVIRPRIWRDESIGFWFRQNIFLYTNDPKMIDRHKDECCLELVHHSILRDPEPPSPLGVLNSSHALLRAIKNTMVRRLFRR